MTDKQSFLERLRAVLTERGISATDAKPYLEQFDRYYDRMASDDLATAESLLDIEGIADNITAQISERYNEIDRLAAQTMTVQTVEVDDEPTLESTVPIVEAESDPDGYEILEEYEEDVMPIEQIYEDIPEEDTSTRLPDYIEEEKIQNNKMFWILLALSLPITLPLAALAFGVFAFAWVGLAAIIVGAIGLLVAVVTGGTLLSLVGIIYGITQLFVSAPIGVYEIGIGIVIAGVVMCVSILLYNFAVRFVPWIIKLVWELFKVALGRLKELFDFLRRECAKL